MNEPKLTMDPKIFNVTWPSYVEHLTEILQSLWNSGEMTDVTLFCEDNIQFKAHKIVLCASSPIFKKIIGDTNSSNQVIYLRGIQSHEMESILRFIYLGQTSFYQNRIEEFLNVAKILEIKEISAYKNDLQKKTEKEAIKTFVKDVSIQNSQITSKNLEIKKISAVKTDLQKKGEKEAMQTFFEKEPIQESKNTAKIQGEISMEIVKTEFQEKETKTEEKAIQMFLKEEKTKPEKEKNDKKLQKKKNDIKPDRDSFQFACHYCERRFRFRNNLFKHLKATHDTKYKYFCDRCEKKFAKERSLRIHIQSVHEDIKIKCDQCDFRGSEPRRVQHHVKSVHEGVRYPCDKCDHKATQLSHLRLHIQAQHEGITYPCKLCNYEALQKTHLKLHVQKNHILVL